MRHQLKLINLRLVAANSFFLLVFIFLGLDLFAQQSKTDSLENVIRHAKNDSIKCIAYSHLISEIMYDEPSKALLFAKEYLNISKTVSLNEEVSANNQLGIIYYSLGLLAKTIEHFSIALSKLEDGSDNLQQARLLNNLALVYGEMGQTERELEYYYQSLQKRLKLQIDSLQLSSIFGNIGVSYLHAGVLDSAKKYIDLSYRIDNVNADSINLLYSTASKAEYFHKSKQYDSAALYFDRVEAMAKNMGGQSKVICENYTLKGKLYFETEEFNKAYTYYQMALELAEKQKFTTFLLDIYKGLAETLSKLERHQQALEYMKEYTTLKDSVFTAETRRQLESAEVQQKEQEIRLLTQQAAIDQLELQKSNIMLYFIMGLASLVLLVAVVYINKHNYKVRMLDLMQIQRNEIAEKNKHILDSITFARGIQEAMFSDEQELKQFFNESFVFNRPSDVVSGDFYWLGKVEEKIIVVVVDCTGHGVPGAFMTVMANSAINNIVNERKIVMPDEILKQLHLKIINSWHKSEESVFRNNGLDAAICVIDQQKKQLYFSGSKRPLFMISNGEFIDIKGDPFSVGSMYYEKEVRFTLHQLAFQKGDQLYLFTDGLIDQFGGIRNKKYLSSRLKDLILKINKKSAQKQLLALEEDMEKWQGEYEQTDDMLLLGLKL